MIVLENVRKTYQMGSAEVHALRGVSLRIEEGEFVALVGASGSGKSTLLHLIGLLDRPDGGTLTIDGREAGGMDDDELSRWRSESIGFVFQQFHLLKRLTALENVDLPLIYAKEGEPAGAAAELLGRVGLGERMGHRPNELSGGQQQRVAIARALLRRPRVVLADEPTGNLDSESGAEIMALLKELHREGFTVVLVTHEPEIAAQAGRVIRMHDGCVVEDRKTPAEAVPRVRRAGQKPVFAPKDFKEILKSNLRQAMRGLAGNKLRTALSALGIIIGVAAVIVMVSIGKGAEASVKQQISRLGSNRLTIFPNRQSVAGVRGGKGETSRLTFEQARSIKGKLPSVAAVSGIVRGQVQVVWGSDNVSTELFGALPDYMAIYDAVPLYGRFFTERECQLRERVVILGNSVYEELFGKANPLGQTVKINRIPFRVIGVLPEKGSSGTKDDDDIVVVPLQTAMYRVLGSKYLKQIDISAASPQQIKQTTKELKALTRQWPQVPGIEGDSYEIRNYAAVAQAYTSVARTVSILLACVASISLVVGGIGIMNIMLVSVTERTKEIGLRKALGATQKDIQIQFLVEAVVLCMAGGLVGVAVGSVVTLIIGLSQGWFLLPSIFSIIISCGVAAGVGIGFGYWPAVQASRLDPIEALRYE